MAPRKNTMTAFDSIMQEFLSEEQGPELLEEGMLIQKGKNRKVPLRYRIIALGFAEHLTIQEVEEKLRAYGCGSLYARSVWEAGLIFAFARGRSYEEWKELEKKCREVREKLNDREDVLGGSSFTLEQLQDYIELNSEEEPDSGSLATRRETEQYRAVLTGELIDDEEFVVWMDDNLQRFALSREKSRYYFCKYLYYYLQDKLDRYLDNYQTASEEERADLIENLVFFKGITRLKRKKMTPEEVWSELRRSSVSSGAIYDAFNNFFFGYASLDWMEVLLEYYGNPESMTERQRKRLAAAARNYSREYKDLTDEEILWKLREEELRREAEEDRIYGLDSEGRGYQKDRSGENAVRKYVRGQLDPDRTALICFLLFFASGTNLPKELVLTEERLDGILTSSGFRKLTEEDDFDWFVLNFLKADDQAEYLIEEVSRYARNEENFFLYRLYQRSLNQDQEFEKIST